MRLCVIAACTFAACGGPIAGGQPDATPSIDAAIEADAAPPIDAPDAGEDVLVSISTSPKSLTPAFSLDVYDYYVRCPLAHDAFTVTVTTTKGSTSNVEDFVPNEDFVVAGAYHIRCLPADFPTLVVTPHPENGTPTPGYYLVSSTHYAMVLDTRGTPVWYQRSNGVVIDVESLAKNEISYAPNAQLPVSVDMTVSFSARDLATLGTTTVQSPDEPTDEHELRRLPNGNFLVITDRIVDDVDVTGLGTFGDDESVLESRIEELDASNNVVWSWNASDHIDPLLECVQPESVWVGTVVAADVFHCNSIDVDASGNLLLSFRNESAVYYVDKTTGAVAWKLGGAAYSKDGAELVAVADGFRLQHDARILSNGDVTLFDDNDATTPSRGVEYALDHVGHTATVAWQYAGSGQSTSQGSFRRYADGHSVLGWGASLTRVLSEVDAQGKDVLDIDFGSASPGISYRAVKVPTSQLDIALLRASAAK